MTISERLNKMDYGPAPESSAEALAWIESRGGLAGQKSGIRLLRTCQASQRRRG